MSIVYCETCDKMTDTDFVDAVYLDPSPKGKAAHLCEYCYGALLHGHPVSYAAVKYEHDELARRYTHPEDTDPAVSLVFPTEAALKAHLSIAEEVNMRDAVGEDLLSSVGTGKPVAFLYSAFYKDLTIIRGDADSEEWQDVLAYGFKRGQPVGEP